MADEREAIIAMQVSGVPMVVIPPDGDMIYIHREIIRNLYVQVLSRPDKRPANREEAMAMLLYLAINGAVPL